MSGVFHVAQFELGPHVPLPAWQGAVREHLAIQVQMVRNDALRTAAGDVYVCGDCFVSTPVPSDG